MRLMCPLCGGETTVPGDERFACECCGGFVRRQPNGRAFLLTPAPETRAEDPRVAELLKKAASSQPEKQKQLLDQAAAIDPESPGVQQALLYLGKLWQRNRRQLNFHLIKCYLLHVFDRPAEQTTAQREAMIAELTGDPQLVKCLSLVPDREVFLKEYLQRLCSEYVQVFLKGDNTIVGSIMGFRVRRLETALAPHVARMIRNMHAAALPEPFDTMLPDAMRETFVRHVGELRYLEAELEK